MEDDAGTPKEEAEGGGEAKRFKRLSVDTERAAGRPSDAMDVECVQRDEGQSAESSLSEVVGTCALCVAPLRARELHVMCAECDDTRLCLPCFMAGREGGGHEDSHAYARIENANFPLLAEDWGVDEELALLEALERHGIGPWQTVAEELGTKSWRECERHYAECYLTGPSAPWPEFDRGFGGIGTPVKAREREPFERPPPVAEARWERPRAQASKRPSKKPRSHLAGEEDGCYHPEVRGYMPKRGDFDTEWANDAEVVIQDIAFDASDKPRDRELKLEVLRAYNAKLSERERRKTFLIERGLLDLKKQRAGERRRGREDRETMVRMKPFARFHAAKEHEALFHGLVEERKLRGEIARLQRYRRLGIRSLAEAHAYENERRKREIEADEKKAKCFMKIGSSASLASAAGTASARRSTKGEPLLMLGAEQDSSRKKRKKGKGPMPAALALEGLPGEEQLEPEEAALCSQHHILPEQYLLAKDALICADTPSGTLSVLDACSILAGRVDAARVTSIHRLLHSKGWIEA